MVAETYACGICGLHYRDKKYADFCTAYCRAHGACCYRIAKRSIELSKG